MQMQTQLQLQEIQRPHQQAQLQQNQIESSHISIISQLHNGSNGVTSNGNYSPVLDGPSSRNNSFTSTNGHNGTISEVLTEDISEKELIDLITCKLCKGYIIDAATLDLCMHTFCRPCAVKYIREQPRCPECNLEIKDKRFLNRLKVDTTMQSIVYKLVPGLYEKEMARRRKFYAARPTITPRYKSEMFGDVPPSKTIKPDDMLNISLTWLKDTQDDDPIKTYLLCRADTTMLVIKKLLVGKFGLDRPIKIYYGASEISLDLTALMDVAVAYNWSPENKLLNLIFKEQSLAKETNDALNGTHSSKTNSSPPTSLDHDP